MCPKATDAILTNASLGSASSEYPPLTPTAMNLPPPASIAIVRKPYE
jgi:hypothetical protein